MAASWNNLGLHGVDRSNRDSDTIPAFYNESIPSSSKQSFARYPSPQPTTSTKSTFTLFPQQQPLLSPPPPSHTSSSTSPSQLHVTAGPRSPSPLNTPVASPLTPGFQTLQRGQFPNSPGSPSHSDPFATPPPTTTTYTDYSAPYQRNSNTSKTTKTSNTNSNDQSYTDTPADTTSESRSNGTSKVGGAMEVMEASEVGIRDGWRPEWLRQRTVGIFLGLFVALALTAELVGWAISQKDWPSGTQGAWTFCPIIVISILAMLWSRVEAQALLYTPWIILEGRPASGEETRRKQAHRTVLLDYPGMSSFKAIQIGFHNRHHLVVASVCASLILRLQVVLSTSAFHAIIQADGTTLLKVRTPIIHIMAGLFCILGALLLPMMYHAPPKHGITARDPTSPAGTAALLASSRHFLARLAGTGSASMETVAARVTGSWYTTELRQPGRKDGGETFELKQLTGGPAAAVGSDASNQLVEWVGQYKPWTLGVRAQGFGIAASLLLLVGTWVVFGVRAGSQGFEASESLFVLWTLIPTLAFTVPGIIWNRVDIDTRRLTPFLKLINNKTRFKEALGLTYMNEFGISTAYKSMRRKDWGVFFRKWMAMLGWVMPIFTAGLFALGHVSQTAQLELQEVTEFRSTSESLKSTLDTDIVERVLIRNTPSYPSWTYQDLAFPELTLLNRAKDWPLPNTELTAKVPALQPSLSCTTVSLSNGAGAGMKCAAHGSSSSNRTAICGDGISTTGRVVSSCSGLSSAYSLNYVWGDCSSDGFMSVLQCNETISNVDVDTTFHTEDISIDTNNIPIALEPTATNSDLDVELSLAYEAISDLASLNTTLEGLDGFFRTLVLSRLDVPLERLSSSDRQNAVSEAIKLQHAILGAQVLNSDVIRHNITSSKLRARADSSIVMASVDYYVPKLTQSRVLSILLAIVLAATLVLSVLALRTTYRGDPLSKNPCSIAAQASLLADSTLWSRLPDGAVWMEDDALARRLRRKTFRLGWHNGGASGRSYGIGIVQDERKALRPAAELDAGGLSGGGRTTTTIYATASIHSKKDHGRYISMRPGLYSYNDIPGLHEKE